MRKCSRFKYYGPKTKNDKIRALQRSLRDDPLEDEQAPTPSGSIEDLSIYPDLEVARP